MKFLIVGNYAADSFGKHIVDTLTLMKHDVSYFSYEPNTYEAKNIFSQSLNLMIRLLFIFGARFEYFRYFHLRGVKKNISRNKYDVIIATHDYLYPADVETIKSLSGAKVCLWYPDPLCTMNRALFIGCDYDYIFLKEPFLVDKFRRLTKLNVHYLPECFNPHAYGEDESYSINQDLELVAFGNFHPWRSLLLNPLLKFKLKLYGVTPPKWLMKTELHEYFSGYPIFNEEKKRSLLSAPIVVNNMHFGEIWGASARIFEVAGIGAFQITEANLGLGELYVIGEELIVYENKDELPNLIEHYLLDVKGRRKIADAAKRRTLSEHTYEQRLELLIEVVFNGASGYPSNLITPAK